MARADESDFLEALIASERVGDWLAEIRLPDPKRHALAHLLDMQIHLSSK